MGFHEDERIRAKNLPYNSAQDLLDAFRVRYWSDNDIIAYAREQLTKDGTNRTMYALIRLCQVDAKEDQHRTHNLD
jgi:hypothetical protein